MPPMLLPGRGKTCRHYDTLIEDCEERIGRYREIIRRLDPNNARLVSLIAELESIRDAHKKCRREELESFRRMQGVWGDG